mmetsp:Transcript_37252/g.100792  ORF Transcript_37252/g.100792 Transcript_37252/m.100792 type:complete len:294 (-) Transcript_37252:57-938(-)
MSREDVLRIFKGSPERYEHLKRRVLELERTPKPVISSAELLKAQENLNKRIRNSKAKQLAARERWLKARQLLAKQITDTARNGAPILRKSKSILFGTDQKVAAEKEQANDSLEGSLRHSGHGLGDFPDEPSDLHAQGPSRRFDIKKSLSTTDIGGMERASTESGSSGGALEPTSVTFNSSAGKDPGSRKRSMRGHGLTVIAQTAGVGPHAPLEADYEHSEEPQHPEHLASRMESRLLTIEVTQEQILGLLSRLVEGSHVGGVGGVSPAESNSSIINDLDDRTRNKEMHDTSGS